MIFCKKSQIDNIKQFSVDKYGCYYLTNDLGIPQIPDIELKTAGFNEKTTTINHVGDLLLIGDTDGREILYDKKNCVKLYQHLDAEVRGYGFGKINILDERNILCSTSSEGEYKQHIYNVDTGEFTEFRKKFNHVLDKGRILLNIQTSSPSISRVDLEGHELWKYNIEGTYIDTARGKEKLSKLSRVLGVKDGLIWLANTSEELYALNLKTGDKAFSCFDAGPANKFSIDNTYNRLVSVTSEYLRTIDLSNGEFKLSKIKMQEVFDKLEFKPEYTGRQFPVADTHLICCDNFKSVVSTIELDNGNVDWVFDLFETRDYAMIKEMTYLSDKLYVLDNVGSSDTPVGSLHVFDRVF